MAGASALATGGRLAAALVSYVRIAWWGIVSPRLQEREPLVVVQAFILSPAGVLLSMRSDLWGWELPGGTPIPGETPEETVHREVWEETGLHIEVERLVGSYERSGFRPHIARVYFCRAKEGVPRISDETVGVGWFDPANPPAGPLPCSDSSSPKCRRIRTMATSPRVSFGSSATCIPLSSS